MVLVPDDGPFVYGISKARVTQVTRWLHERAASFFSSELPPSQPTLPSFYVDRFEVTNEQYGRFLKANPRHRKPKFWSYPQYNGAWDPESHAMRGGCFLNTDAQVRTTVRWAAGQEAEVNGAPWLGFRCVKDKQP